MRGCFSSPSPLLRDKTRSYSHTWLIQIHVPRRWALNTMSLVYVSNWSQGNASLGRCRALQLFECIILHKVSNRQHHGSTWLATGYLWNLLQRACPCWSHSEILQTRSCEIWGVVQLIHHSKMSLHIIFPHFLHSSHFLFSLI